MNKIYDKNCTLCPRLVAYRQALKLEIPDGLNAPVQGFGDPQARLLIVGLAPGKNGANRTGRPFTGDFAGDLLYATLLRFGFAAGTYGGHSRDGLRLLDCRITNAVKCVPPQNKPVGAEINTCRDFLIAEIESMTKLQAILCLGKVSHDSVIKTLGLRQKDFPFAHAAVHHHTPNGKDGGKSGGLQIYDSYHCSRYNTNTRRLNEAMFGAVFENLKSNLTLPTNPPAKTRAT